MTQEQSPALAYLEQTSHIPSDTISRIVGVRNPHFSLSHGIIQLLQEQSFDATLSFYSSVRVQMVEEAFRQEFVVGNGIVATALIPGGEGQIFYALLHVKTFEGEDRYLVGEFDTPQTTAPEYNDEVPIELIESLRISYSLLHEQMFSNELDKHKGVDIGNIYYFHCSGCFATLRIETRSKEIESAQAALFFIDNASHTCPCCGRLNTSEDGMHEFPDQKAKTHFVFARKGIDDSQDPNLIRYLGEMDKQGHIKFSSIEFKRSNPTFGSLPHSFGSRTAPFGLYIT